MKLKTFVLFFCLAVMMTGCAQSPHEGQLAQESTNAASEQSEHGEEEQEESPDDPFEGVNRVMWDLNWNILDKYILRPVTVGYMHITSKSVRTSLDNAVENLEEPANLLNSLLQGKPHEACVATSRFLINSTVGLLGFFDVAKELGVERHEEDFGQTMGVWGVGDGPFLMLPAYGPSTVRNFTGDYADSYIYPSNVMTVPQKLGKAAIKAVNFRADLMSQEQLLYDSVDSYALIKEIYFQRVAFELYDGSPPEEEPEVDLDEYLDELE
ncbi:MlaA family lipoprotein [Algicola sagamiensis]|uniref:MlaA family lipoprotein n=1 Tax=Algicola sagamiensis TaxID=163869 RepID=UPI00035EAF80|nr:VacJ family lipoprotein [Algicola sagamiensis]